MNKPKWSNKQPTQEGWYWFRYDDQCQPHVIQVFKDDERYLSVRLGPCVDDVNWLDNYKGQWSGPIPEPVETEPSYAPSEDKGRSWVNEN